MALYTPTSPMRRARPLICLFSDTIHLFVLLQVLLPRDQGSDGEFPTIKCFGGVAAFDNRQRRAQGFRYHSLNEYHRRQNPNKIDFVKSFPRQKRQQLFMLPPLPSSYEYDDSVVFFQRATGTRISGRDELEASIRRWNGDFQTEVDSDDIVFGSNEMDDGNRDPTGLQHPVLQTKSATTTSPTTLLVRWSLTYVDASIRWMLGLAESIPGWSANFVTYTDKVSEERRFSYSDLAKVFATAFATGKLRIPLACIDGITTCEFREAKGKRQIRSMTEDLAYAQDLNRGAMANRVCARDLQFFLETARKPPEYYHREGTFVETKTDTTQDKSSNSRKDDEEIYWEDHVTSALPWRSVPGMMDPLYIEAQAEEDLTLNVPLLFGAVSIGIVVLFASWIAPNLIGQSLFGSHTYVLPPSELNDIIAY